MDYYNFEDSTTEGVVGAFKLVPCHPPDSTEISIGKLNEFETSTNEFHFTF